MGGFVNSFYKEPLRVPRESNQPMARMTVEFVADYPPTRKRKGEKATMPQGAALILISSGFAKEVSS